MKLLRYGPKGFEKPAAVDSNGVIRDLSSIVPDITPEQLDDASLSYLAKFDLSKLPVVDPSIRYAPVVSRIGKFICVGLNYSDHAAETGAEIPVEPIIFLKANSAISGCNDPIILPKGSKKTDWEVELGVVIGKRASYVAEEEALKFVAGYCVINDVSEREYQLERGGTWDKGKGCDTFGPIGPWLVTRDEVPDPQNMTMWLTVDGKLFQSGSTRTMIFGVAHLISYISRFMTLEPGDVISTGTPPGVGLGQKPPIFLEAGNSVRLGITGLGHQEQTVCSWNSYLAGR